LTRLDRLGPNWHIVDWPRTDAQGFYEPDLADDRAGFLAIGPGGIYAVTVADHGRSRVLIAGDVVQINGKRPAYIAEARREARRASKALSAAVGLSVPVTPVLTFVGNGVISVHGLPKEVLVSTDKELDRLLIAGGRASRRPPPASSQPSHITPGPGQTRPIARPVTTGGTPTDKRPLTSVRHAGNVPSVQSAG